MSVEGRGKKSGEKRKKRAVETGNPRARSAISSRLKRGPMTPRKSSHDRLVEAADRKRESARKKEREVRE